MGKISKRHERLYHDSTRDAERLVELLEGRTILAVEVPGGGEEPDGGRLVLYLDDGTTLSMDAYGYEAEGIDVEVRHQGPKGRLLRARRERRERAMLVGLWCKRMWSFGSSPTSNLIRQMLAHAMPAETLARFSQENPSTTAPGGARTVTFRRAGQ